MKCCKKCSVEYHNKKLALSTTEIYEIQHLLTIRRTQKVRKQLRDLKAVISGLSKPPFLLLSQPIFRYIPTYFQRRSIPHISFSFSSKITGIRTTGSSLKMSGTTSKYYLARGHSLNYARSKF